MKGKYKRRCLFSGVSFLLAVIMSLAIWHLAEHAGVTMAEAVKLSIRAGIFKSIEVVTDVYDPYSPHLAKLGPEDWNEWPPNALEPKLAVARLQTLEYSSGDTITLGQAILRQVNDRAALFAYQASDAEELHDLRERYHLSAQFTTKASQMALFAEINDWVRQQWIHGVDGSVDFRQFSASDIIQSARKGARYWCQVASMTFIQVLSSMGYQSRLLSLSGQRGSPPDHAVAEVWVDDIQKWVVFDTDFNLYYVDESGMPLNALELHRSLSNGRTAGITAVKGPYRPEVFDVEEVGAQPLLLPYYRYFYLDMRNDWLTNVYFPGHPRRSDKSTLRWEDVGQQETFLDLIPNTSDETELYWPLNHVEIRLGVGRSEGKRSKLDVYLKTVTPNFERFEIGVNDRASFSHTSSTWVWVLEPGVNTLTVRAVNVFGVKGSPSRLGILVNKVGGAQ